MFCASPFGFKIGSVSSHVCQLSSLECKRNPKSEKAILEGNKPELVIKTRPARVLGGFWLLPLLSPGLSFSRLGIFAVLTNEITVSFNEWQLARLLSFTEAILIDYVVWLFKIATNGVRT